MNQLTPFQFEQFPIRVVTDENGEALFVGKDVCEALGYANPNDAMKQRCKGVAKRYPLMTPGGMQEVRVLTESDVMRLIVTSSLPSAEPFERWVFEEVLPSIRKTGTYSVIPESSSLNAQVRAQIGGILKAVVHKEISDVMEEMVPSLVQGYLASHQTSLRYGKTAGQIWDSFGLPKIKNGAVMLSNRLELCGCLVEGGGRAEMGGRTSKLFDPDKSAKVMKSGLLEFCQRYVKERQGQGNLFALKPI